MGAPVVKFAGLCSMVRRVQICICLFSVVHYYQKTGFLLGEVISWCTAFDELSIHLTPTRREGGFPLLWRVFF